MRLALLLLALLAASPALAGPPPLALPIDCTLGETCFIQNYVDDDPGPDAADFACGSLTYDGHKGTDFALPSFAAMEAGVTVRAAAPGVVRAIRDDMPDTGLAGTPAEILAGRDCGNGLVIDHGDGWESQYCHLRAGSVTVAPGQRVASGTPLGLVGYSGVTEFPHLHLSLRHDGAVVDPFAPEGRTSCAGPAPDSLWQEPPAYAPGGIIALGASDAVPQYAEIKAGTADQSTLASSAPALVGWAYLFGTRAGDRLEIRLIAPDGTTFVDQQIDLDRAQAQLFRATGRKAPATGLAPGQWSLTARLTRAGEVVDHAETRIELTD